VIWYFQLFVLAFRSFFAGSQACQKIYILWHALTLISRCNMSAALYCNVAINVCTVGQVPIQKRGISASTQINNGRPFIRRINEAILCLCNARQSGLCRPNRMQLWRPVAYKLNSH
jgi:hypothetical protein